LPARCDLIRLYTFQHIKHKTTVTNIITMININIKILLFWVFKSTAHNPESEEVYTLEYPLGQGVVALNE
jgi:hypothetical protein